MPIRTNRGRAAVYRRLWGWPLRSPRHLVVTGLGVTVLAIAIAVILSHANGRGATPAAATSTPGATTITVTPGNAAPPASMAGIPSSTTPAQITRLSAPLETPSTAPAAPDALSVIEAWGRAWVNHPAGMTSAQWLAQLKPYTTDEFLPQMSTVNLANISATAVTGQPQVEQSFTSSVEALLPTNGGNLDITAVKQDDGSWQVSAYTEAS
jgi:hypothetical protein